MDSMQYAQTLDDKADDILKVREGRWYIEEYFRIMKTDFLQDLSIYITD